MNKLDELDTAGEARAFSFLSPLIEKAPRLAKKAAAVHPFRTTEHLLLAIRGTLLGLGGMISIDMHCSDPVSASGNSLEMTNGPQCEQKGVWLRLGRRFRLHAGANELEAMT